MGILVASPVYRWGDQGLRKVTKLKTDCKWYYKSIEEEWPLSQELPGCITNEKTGCTEEKRSILEKSQRLREEYQVMKIWWGCLCYPDQSKRATPDSKAEKVKGKSMISVISDCLALPWSIATPCASSQVPAEACHCHEQGCGGACESRKTAPTPREQCKFHSARRTQRQLYSSTWSFCMGHLMVINMTITIWKRK